MRLGRGSGEVRLWCLAHSCHGSEMLHILNCLSSLMYTADFRAIDLNDYLTGTTPTMVRIIEGLSLFGTPCTYVLPRNKHLPSCHCYTPASGTDAHSHPITYCTDVFSHERPSDTGS